MSNGMDIYKQTSIRTASQEELLLMLYRAAIKHCKKAIEAIEAKNLAAKGQSIGKLQDIIIELSNSLDHEIGGDISKELDSLYDFMLYSTTQANIKIDKIPLEGTLTVLQTLYKGWIDAIKEMKNNDKKAA
jgi:flagellar protein FliS